MDHGIPRVLPPLVDQARLGPRAVLDEAVPVHVPVPVDPFEGSADVRQQLLRRGAVARPPVVLREQQDEPRCRVDGAVVRRVWDRPRPRQFAPPDLMEDLARLLVSPRVVTRSLVPGQQAQRVARRSRRHGQELVRRDQRIPAEHGHVPGDAGRQHGLAPPLCVEGAQVAQAAGEQRVEQLVVGDDLHALALPLFVGAAELVHRCVEFLRGRHVVGDDRLDGHGDEPGLVRAESESERGPHDVPDDLH